MVNVFTDGSSYKNGKPECVAGCGIFIVEGDVRISLCVEDAAKMFDFKLTNQSNNVGELMAILVGLCSIEDKSQEVTIYTDSTYCINSIVTWSKSWIKNNWVNSTGGKVKNKELIIRILEEKEKFKFVFFVHVKGHKTKPKDETSEEYFLWNGNDISDKLANLGTKSGRINLKTIVPALK